MDTEVAGSKPRGHGVLEGPGSTLKQCSFSKSASHDSLPQKVFLMKSPPPSESDLSGQVNIASEI